MLIDKSIYYYKSLALNHVTLALTIFLYIQEKKKDHFLKKGAQHNNVKVILSFVFLGCKRFIIHLILLELGWLKRKGGMPKRSQSDFPKRKQIIYFSLDQDLQQIVSCWNNKRVKNAQLKLDRFNKSIVSVSDRVKHVINLFNNIFNK